MNLSPAEVDAHVDALVADQQLEFEGQINALVLALRNQRPDARRAGLMCMLCILVTAKPLLPVQRWLPFCPEAEQARHHIFFRGMHDEMMRYFEDWRMPESKFLATLETLWRLT